MHWAAAYIGRPFKDGGRGPDAFDCWGLVTYLYQERLKVELPLFEDVSVDEKKVVSALINSGAAAWQKIDKPVEMCAVGMSSHLRLHHVGLWLDVDGGLILHAMNGRGVLAQSLDVLHVNGWRRIDYYSWPQLLK